MALRPGSSKGGIGAVAASQHGGRHSGSVLEGIRTHLALYVGPHPAAHKARLAAVLDSPALASRPQRAPLRGNACRHCWVQAGWQAHRGKSTLELASSERESTLCLALWQ